MFVGGDLPVMHPLSMKSGRRRGRRQAESLVTIAPLYMLSVGVGGGGGHLKAIQPLARPPEDTPTFWG